MHVAVEDPAVLRLAELPPSALPLLVSRYGLDLVVLADGQPITGSFWGEPEAGIVGTALFVRGDTPLHSALHELCHLACMTAVRRAALVKDAGGDAAEECAVCYLQILLADEIAGVGRERLMGDMNRWGYNFRLGSTERWFADDAHDAGQWLREHALLDSDGRLTWRLREA
ncbi:MAG: hypothetical protein KDI09_07295 [Halioglobus sp.]|nr:hypothetical protein [Halioglobus sp.]